MERRERIRTGKRSLMETKFCQICGSQIHIKAEICPKCGVRQPRYLGGIEIHPALQGRNRVVAALLAIFLGGLGVHKFYLGRIGWGIIYLLFCWTFIPCVIGFIEGLIYLTMSDAEFDKNYGQKL